LKGLQSETEAIRQYVSADGGSENVGEWHGSCGREDSLLAVPSRLN